MSTGVHVGAEHVDPSDRSRGSAPGRRGSSITPNSPMANLRTSTLLVFALSALGVAAGGRGGSPTTVPEGAIAVRCSVVTYTPPQAEARPADLCVPVERSGRDAVRRNVGVILVHGGGGVQGGRSDLRAWAERYGRSGYLTLLVDYYLMPPEPVVPTYPRPEREVKSAVQYLRRNAAALGLDPERLVVQGHSAGARLAAQVLTTPDDPYFAGPERWPGTSNRVGGFVGFYGAYNGAQLFSDDYYGGGPDSPDPAVRERWAKANSTAHAANAAGPALLFHGDADSMAPLQQTLGFAAALRAAGNAVQAIVVPGAEHGFDRERSVGRPLSPAPPRLPSPGSTRTSRHLGGRHPVACDAPGRP